MLSAVWVLKQPSAARPPRSRHFLEAGPARHRAGAAAGKLLARCRGSKHFHVAICAVRK